MIIEAEERYAWSAQSGRNYVSTLLRVLVTLERGSSISCVETTNFALTLPFTLDIKLPASRADRLFLIAFEAQ